MRSGNGTMASWFPLSRLYTCTTALSACAANTCELLTASPFCAVALFLKTWRCAANGCSSCTKMPASLVTPVFALVGAEMDATKCSVSMLAAAGVAFDFVNSSVVEATCTAVYFLAAASGDARGTSRGRKTIRLLHAMYEHIHISNLHVSIPSIPSRLLRCTCPLLSIPH